MGYDDGGCGVSIYHFEWSLSAGVELKLHQMDLVFSSKLTQLGRDQWHPLPLKIWMGYPSCSSADEKTQTALIVTWTTFDSISQKMTEIETSRSDGIGDQK